MLQVIQMKAHVEQGGAIQDYRVKLLVDGKSVGLHFYNTTHGVNIQSNEMLKTFYEKAIHGEQFRTEGFTNQITQ